MARTKVNGYGARIAKQRAIENVKQLRQKLQNKRRQNGLRLNVYQ